MGRPALTDEQREAARRRIADAAITLYREGGLEATTMRAVASRLGVAPSSIYLHYRNRYDMLTAIWQDAVARAYGAIEARLDGEPDPLARARLLLEGYVRFAVDNPEVFVAAFLNAERTEDMPEPRPRSVMAPFGDRLTEAIARGQATGATTDAAPPDTLAQAAWAAVHGAMALPYDLPRFDFRPPGELGSVAVELAMRALLPTPADPR